MTYPEAIQYLESFINYERISKYSYKSAFRLERMDNLLSLFDHPERKFNSIHITGTKGKGSTSAMVFSILTEAGFSVGLYTSPHLVDFRERIRIAQDKSWRLISEEEVISLVEEIKPKIESLEEKPSFFELYTTLAFLYFAQNKSDFVVAEVGLGGRLDATNVLNPLVCGITSLSFEHTDKLGNTLTAIAKEKCGIIKENSVVVTSPQEEEAKRVIYETCKDKKARLFEVGKNIFFEEIGYAGEKEIFRLRGIFDEY
ncbi:MAG: Mur ligase family protein, partial [Candidatus Omnitrophica bacterium]|nr:Mur ligase family protein [Candidatus Omnitrophota bacterium]